MLDWQKNTKLRLFIRTICIVLVVTFLSYDLTWAGAGEVFSNKNRHASQDSPSVEIPEEIGVVKESYTSKYNLHKLVIHIQDAHANVEAQQNEAKIVQYLQDKYNIHLVSVEGGFGDFDAGFFRSFPKDKKIRDKIAKYFLSKAFISGTDYLLVTENEPPTVYGAEDKELYASHLNTFKENQAFSDSLNRSLKTVEDVVDTLKNKYYSKDLREFSSKTEDFRQGRLSLEEYISYLNIASIIHNVDLSKFPNLSRIINLQELEHKINFDKAESERQDLIDSLTKALSKADLEELVKKSLDFKANKLTPAEYYSYLEKLTQDSSINPSGYNNLLTYIKYIALSENLDNSKVFEEIDSFSEAVKDRLTSTLAQKDIEQISSIIRILKGFSNINLSPKDYEYFKGNREVFNSKAIAGLLRRYTNTSILNSLPLDTEIASLEKFYSLAHDRDDAIIRNSLNRLNRDYSSNSVIIVAGGFHTQGLTSILKEKDISYVVIAPSIKSSQEKENTYFALLKDKRIPLEDVLNDPDTLQIINSISDPEARQVLVNYWVARASRYYSVKELQAQLDRMRLSTDDQRAVEIALNEISSRTQLAKKVEVTEEEPVIEVKPVPDMPQGPTLFERFASFISSLKPKPKETKLTKQKTIPTSHTETKELPEGIAAGKQEQVSSVPAPAAIREPKIDLSKVRDAFYETVRQAGQGLKTFVSRVSKATGDLVNGVYHFVISLRLPKHKESQPATVKTKPEVKIKTTQIATPKIRINLRPFLTGISVFTLSLYFSTVALGQDNSPSSKIFASFSDIFTHGVTIFLAIAGTIGYFAYRIIKKISSKEKTPVQGIAPVVIEPAIVTTPGRPQVTRPVARITSNSQSIQPNHNLPITMRQELENRIQQLSGSIAQGSRDALARSFRPVGSAELPLPMPLSMLNQDASDRDKVIHILENMQRMMDGTDEKVLRDFERAIDNVRDRVTEQALDQYETLSDEALYNLLTDGYIAELQREFQRIIDNQIQHMIRFHTPTPKEQALYVSEEINERYGRLPRYLKWILTNNPQIENDPLVQEWIATIERRMSQIPAFPEMITGYSKVALNKSLYLNPEIARRVLLYLAKKASQDLDVTEGDVRREIQAELARNMPEDVIEGRVIVPEEEGSISELPATPQARALPAPNMSDAESKRARLKALTDDYNQFLIKFREQNGIITKVQTDLRELSEGLEEAKRQNDRIVIEALQPAVDGLTSKLRKVKEKIARFEQEKARYEEQINSLRRELGEAGNVNLYALDPVSIGVVAVFTVLFGIPLYITKKILNKWYNTTAGKTLGMTAAIGSLVAGYYVYLSNLTPKIQEIFTNFKEADWPILATLLIIWPVSIVSGIFGGKIGKGISHERLYWKANSEFKKGNTDEAISLINQAIKLNSKNAADYNLLAECQRKKRHFDEAIASYNKAIEIEPNNSVRHNDLGVVYVEKGDEAKAIESYRRSLELEANDPIVLANLGRVLHRKGQLLEAVRAFQRAQEIKPDSSVTEELNQILRQTGNIPKSQKPQDLEYAKTLSESLRIEKERSWISQLSYDDTLSAVAWLGAIAAWIAGGIFLYYVPYGHHWDLGTTDKPATLGYVVWIGEIVVAPLLGAGLSVAGVWIGEKVTSVVKTVYRFLTFPLTYRKLQKVNLLPSDELSDRDITSVAPVYARMSKEYLEKIFRSWMEAGQEEKIARLFKFGSWKSEKTRIYGDIGEYKRVSRLAATKFATTVQEQKIIFDGIDREKEKLSQKGANNAVGLMKDILPLITEHSRDRDEFWHWLTLVTGLPKNILDQGSRQVLTVFTDLREFDRMQEESLNKFAAGNQEAGARARSAINGLVQKLERDGLNYPGILKKVLADINQASQNLDEFLFWVNEVMQFEKQWLSSGSYVGLLQNLIAYVRAKEEASKRLCHNPQETSQLFQTVDSLREELRRKQVSGDVSVLKDVIPRVAEASRTLAEFFDYIAVLKAFDKNIWYGTQTVLQAFNNHVAYKQAMENAATKFTQDDAARSKFLNEIDNLRNQLVQKGLPQASDLLKDVLPEVTKTCRSKEEFIYWLGELVGLNITVWRSGVQAVVNNFNDLAGFRQAKEMALDKLCVNQQEKDDLGRVIDSLKAKLEEKKPSCAGLIKDVILEILKDIDTLANPPYRKNDFIWWLTMCVNFEAQTWAGTKQALAGYQELKNYIIKRRELSARFATNQEEQQRLTAAWDNLDRIANFSRPAFISLLNNTLDKIASVAGNPREFVFWIGTFSELKSDVLEALCRDIATAIDYYKNKGKNRDFNHLPSVLNLYYKTYHQTILITAEALDILTDPSVDIQKRVEKAYQYIVTQKIVKLGAPPNLVGLQDIVSFEQLLANPEIGESGFSSMLNYHWQEESSSSDEYGSSYSYDTDLQPVRQIVPKMGREGLYSYWEAQHPTYYQQFLEEAKGLAPGFNRPEEKFRVAYDGSAISLTKEEEVQVMPITDNVQALKQLIQYVRMEWPNLYDNFIGPKRELIKGRPLEEFVTADTASKMTQQLLNKVQTWQVSEEQKLFFVMKLIEILTFQETADIRINIASASNNFSKLKAIAAYWERISKLVMSQKWLQEKSKYYHPAVKIVRQKIRLLNDKLVDVGEGILQFYLSGHTMADFFRGSISRECTAYGGLKFKESIGQVTDPSFFLFKIIEKGKWVGNVYTVVAKTDDGKFALYLEWFKLARDHQLVANTLWDDRRAEFMKDFFSQFKAYLASQGFDYLIVTTATSATDYILYKFTQDQARAEANNSGPVAINLKKLSGSEHLREGSLPIEYLQNFGGDGSNSLHSVSGYKISLDKTSPEVIQQKQRELDYLERLLGEMSSEETRLAGLAKERREELNHLNKKGQEAANAGKNTLASQFKNASDQKTAEVQKIEYELNELKIRVREKKDELEHLAVELGLRRGSSPVLGGRFASIIPAVLLPGLLFAEKAQAQGYSSGDLLSNPFAPILLIGGIAGFFGLLYYILNRLFPQRPERDTYYERQYLPRPAPEQYKFPDDLKAQLDQVLSKISAEARGIVPKYTDIRIPFEVGISRTQALKALRLLFTTLIKDNSILDFFKDKEFYIAFKQKAKELGLADDFDQPQGKSYFFTVPKEQIRYEEDRRAEEFIAQYLSKIRKTQAASTDDVLEKIHHERSRLIRKDLYRGATQVDLYAYYQLLLSYAALGSKAKLDEINDLLSEKNYLGALSVLEEFFRIDIGGELIALEQNARLKDALNRVLQREIEDIRWQFNRCTSFQANKQRIIREAKDIQFELRLSERTADDVLRGVASGDCTSINGSAFYNTIPQFMLDPGLLVFKVIQDDKWVGNVYTVVAEREGNPVLIIDAVQLPVWGRSWPVSVKELSDKVVEKVVEYASSQGFSQVLMSSFVSNFNAIHDHFDQKYPAVAQEIEKTAGFEHLKALGLWDAYASRNEYLETYSPHWNYSLKRVDPNNPKQALLLRTIWERIPPEEIKETQPIAPLQEKAVEKSPSQALRQPVKKDTSKKNHAFRNFCTGVLLAAALFLSSGCATAFHSRIGPVVIQSRTEVTLSEPKPHEPPLSIYGSIELGERTKKKETAKIAEARRDSQGVELSVPGSARLGPLTGEITPKIGLRDVPGGEAPISISAGASLGEKVKKNKDDTEGVELAAEARVRLGHLTAQADPKVGLSDVPEGQKPIDLKGDIRVEEVKEQPVLQEESHSEIQSPDTQRIITQIEEQIKSIQAELEKLRQADSELKIEVSNLRRQLADAQRQIEQLRVGQKLPGEVGQLEEKKSGYERQIASLEMQQQQAQAELDRILAEKEKANREVRDLQSQTPRMQQQVESLQGEVRQLETQKKQSEENVVQLQSQKSGLETSVNQLTQDKQKLEQELTGLRQQIGQAQAILDEAKIKSEPTFKNIWLSLPWQGKLGIILLGLTGIGILVGGVILWRRWSRFRNLSDRVKELQQKADDLERQLAGQRKEKEDLTKEIEQQKAQTADLEAEKKRQDEELKKITEQLVALKEEHQRIQQELIQAREEKEKTIRELEEKLNELKSQITEKESEIASLSAKKEAVAVTIAPQEPRSQLSDVEIDRSVELLRALPSKEMQRLLRSQKIDVRERIRFLHDELGLDIVNGHGRSLLFRNPDTLRNQKAFLESLGLPLTVTNLASSKRGFAKKELNQIIKQEAWKKEWDALTNEEKLSVVSHLYDIYGLRVSWLLRDNDWYQLLHAFGLPGEPINYTPCSIDFIQRYELARFHKFHNIPQAKYRLSKIKEVIKILDLKVINLLDTRVTPEGFEIFVVKPEVYEGKIKYDEKLYPLPKTPLPENIFVSEPLESASEQPEEVTALEPKETTPAPELEEKASHLKEEIAGFEKTIVGLEEERKQKTAQLDQQIYDLVQQKERLTQEILKLESDLEAKRRVLSLAAAQAEEKVNYEQAIQDLKQKINAYQQELNALEQQKDKARQELTALQDTSAARAQIEALNNELRQSEENLRKIKEEIASLTVQRKQLEEDVSSYQGKKNKLQEETTALGKKVEELNQAISSLEAEKDALAKQETERAAQIKTTQLNQQIESLTRQKEEFTQQINALEDEVKAKQRELSLSISEAEAQARRIKEEITSLTQELTTLREEREKLKVETAGLKGIQQDADSKKQELLDLDKERQSLQEEIHSLEAQRTTLKQSVDKTRQEIEDLKHRFSEQEATQALSQQALTEEQQKLQAQLEAQKQNIQSQINALDEEFNKKKQEQLATLLRLEEEKTKAKTELDILTAQRETARQELDKLNMVLEDLKKEVASYKKAVEGWNKQIELLKEEVAELKEQKAELSREIEALKKAEEIKPEADALLTKARAISKEVSSLYLHEKAKSQSVDTFVSLVRQKSHTGNEEAIRKQLKESLMAMGARVVLECGPQCGDSDAPKNLVVEFPGTGKFAKEPGFIINAHMDTVTHSTPEEMEISDKIKGFSHRRSGSLGADDKGGLTVLLEALRFVKANYWDKGIDHRRVVFVITAEEEPSPIKSGFARGAEHLTSRHQDIFKNVLFSLTSDGPLDYGISDPDNSFVIVVSEKDREKEPYSGIIKTIQEIGISKGKRIEITTEGLGIGDFAHFPRDAKAGLHIRSPYEGNHRDEVVKIKNLIDYIDFWIGLIDKYSCGMSDIPRTPNISGLPRAMVFDLDRTLSRTLRIVPTEVLEQIRGFLRARVKIAIITAQSLEEVKTYLIEPLHNLLKTSGDSDELLSELFIGPSEGSQLWQFYTEGQFREVILGDATSVPFDTKENKEQLYQVVRSAMREVIRPAGDIPVLGPVLTQNPGITFIHNRGYSLSLSIKEDISEDKKKGLIEKIKRNAPSKWQIDILVSGGGTIHIVSKEVDKSVAVGMFRNYLPPDIKPRQILIIGDDFGPGGLDRKLIIPGAKIYSVGAKHNIPPEVEFYDKGGKHGWQRSLHLFVNRIKSDFAGAAKGRGMFSPDEHIEVNEVIMAAQRENRGSLIWGDAAGWKDNRAKHAQDIAWVISSLKRYPEIKITELGKIDIPEVLSAANIVLIVPRNNSPPGLLVNDENAYQIAHNGLSRNSIYIDQVTYEQLYTFEVAVLLAHEAIILGAKKLAARKGIPWTEQLAKDVSRIAEEYEIKIVGKSEKGRGSRFDERIGEILEFNKPKPKQTKPVIEEPPADEPEEKLRPIPPQPQPKPQKKHEPSNNNFSLDFPDTRNSVIEGLRKLFFDSMFRDTTNLPAKFGDFPPPMAREIKESYDLGKIKGMPLDPDFLVALTVFFSRIFPNHANELINYLQTLDIYIIDNGRSTFGATLSGNTFYIQRSCLEDLLGRPISVEEIKQGIKSRDKQILVALFRIIVHEIGSAFFKLSHPADQDLERLFLGLLSKTLVRFPPSTEQEFRTINSSINLNDLPRIDWASKKLRPTDLMREEAKLTQADMAGLVKEINAKLVNSLYSPSQEVRNNAAVSLVRFGAVEALPFLRLLLEKEPDNKIVSDAIKALEEKFNKESAEKLRIKTADPFAGALFSIDENNDLVLGNSAIQAINMLCAGYDGMTLEIDVATLIDTSRGIPQLKGLGFREALASLYQAQEKKQIPENIRVRLINIDPALDKKKIIKVLGLTDDLLESLVTIPDIPQDYVIKTLEPYLIAGSIRIIFEDNVRYWGKKVDVLVKRGEETKTLSSLGLIVASLSKEPKFYEQLPKELKEYIVAKTDENGKVELDDEGKIKQLIFKPIEKSKVDIQYLDKLDKANKELEGMV